MYIGLRPITSDVVDQANRPPMLNSDRTPTKPLAAATLTVDTPLSRKQSWMIGLACSRMPMLAVALQNRTIHTNQNQRVLIALFALTMAVVTSGLAATVAGSKPAGFHPGAATRTFATPNIMITK